VEDLFRAFISGLDHKTVVISVSHNKSCSLLTLRSICLKLIQVCLETGARLYENQLLEGWVPFPKAAADVVAARAERYKHNCILSSCVGNLS